MADQIKALAKRIGISTTGNAKAVAEKIAFELGLDKNQNVMNVIKNMGGASGKTKQAIQANKDFMKEIFKHGEETIKQMEKKRDKEPSPEMLEAEVLDPRPVWEIRRNPKSEEFTRLENVIKEAGSERVEASERRSQEMVEKWRRKNLQVKARKELAKIKGKEPLGEEPEGDPEEKSGTPIENAGATALETAQEGVQTLQATLQGKREPNSEVYVRSADEKNNSRAEASWIKSTSNKPLRNIVKTRAQQRLTGNDHYASITQRVTNPFTRQRDAWMEDSRLQPNRFMRR